MLYPKHQSDYEHLLLVRDVGNRPSIYCLICRRAELCDDASLMGIGRAMRTHVCEETGQ